MIFYNNKLIYTLSLWLGIIMSLLASGNMYKSLDRALDYDEKTARRKIYIAYLIRYAVLIAILTVVCVTKYLDPLITFLGYMMLKLGAMIQPLTHKLYNKLFNETDPEPLTQEEYEALRAAEQETQVDAADDAALTITENSTDDNPGNTPDIDKEKNDDNKNKEVQS